MHAANAGTEDIFITGCINGLIEAQTRRPMLSFHFALLGSSMCFLCIVGRTEKTPTEGWNLITSLAELSFRHQ